MGPLTTPQASRNATDRSVAPPNGAFDAGLATPGVSSRRPPACYRASWQLPGPDFHRQATTSLSPKDQPNILRKRSMASTIGMRPSASSRGPKRCSSNPRSDAGAVQSSRLFLGLHGVALQGFSQSVNVVRCQNIGQIEVLTVRQLESAALLGDIDGTLPCLAW
jgi:hypothetical protein